MGTDTTDRHLSSVDAEEELARRADAEGKTIEELAAEREAGGDFDPDAAEPVPPTQIPLPGTFETISKSAGGAAPTSSEIRIVGHRRPVEGQYQKGDVIRLEVEAKIGEVAFIDTTDEWGTVQKTVRAHKARMLGVRVISS
jgi:hypothetical protein